MKRLILHWLYMAPTVPITLLAAIFGVFPRDNWAYEPMKSAAWAMAGKGWVAWFRFVLGVK